MSEQKKPARLRRFRSTTDLGQKWHGWHGLGGNFAEGMLHQTKGWCMAHVVWINADSGEPLYDQPLIIEDPGTILLCTTPDGKIGFVPSFRPTGPRLSHEPNVSYVRHLANQDGWSTLVESLGRWMWELPRGIAPPGEANGGKGEVELLNLIKKIAMIEAATEAGFAIDNIRVLKARLNPNTTFFPHGQYVVVCNIASMGEQRPEALEFIGRVKLFTGLEVRQMIDRGEIEDALTLAAFVLAGVRV